MISVLLNSSKVVTSGWAAVRGSTEVHVTGMGKDDQVEVAFRTSGASMESVDILADTILPLPINAEFVQAAHIEAAAEGSCICVDLR